MNLDEARTYKYLRVKFGENVVFEPDGNIPPDFLVNSQYAIEVRRLNQNFFDNGTSQGLELLSIPISDAFNDVLKSFDSKFQGKNYWVSIDYERPLGISIRQAKKDVKNALNGFLASKIIEFPHVLLVSESVELKINPSRTIDGRVFRPALGTDGDGGGWVIQTYIENLRYCITEKSLKITNYLPKYREWLLYLVDHMGWGLDVEATGNLVSSISDIGNFDGGFIISNNGEDLLASISKKERL
jgi:hypothetical protein